MPRQLRIEYEGAIYHVMNRGNRRENIVRSDRDRELFVTTLAEACEKCRWEMHAWCLMRNHFHLAVETPLGNLVAGMKWFLGTYTIRFNARHRACGHLFAGRYKSLVVDDRDPHYLREVCDYIHLNPARAGLLKEEDTLGAYRWSSYGDYLKKPRDRPKWMRVDRVLGEHGIRCDDARGRKKFARRMESRRAEGKEGEKLTNPQIERGWRFGSEEFAARLLKRIEGKSAVSHFSREQEESMERSAQKIVKEGLKKAGWKEERLKIERKGHPEKVRLAKRLRSETTMSLKWIAERISMGTWTYVSNLLRTDAARLNV